MDQNTAHKLLDSARREIELMIENETKFLSMARCRDIPDVDLQYGIGAIDALRQAHDIVKKYMIDNAQTS